MTAETITVANPILNGMYPDPSWIWDDSKQRITLVNSSFELVPGLPIHVSDDLAHWTHASDAIDPDMARRLLIPFVEDSGGVYAPTLCKIAGKYVIACTIARIDTNKAAESGCSQEELEKARLADGNFIIEADDIEGPWRGPYWICGAEGIDPDIFEDCDGSVYWTQTRPAAFPQWEGQTEVWTQRIDPRTWTLVEDEKSVGCAKTVIWRGYGMEAVWAEGPHLYRIGDYVYLLTAEGGTSFEHSEMAMRIHAPNGLAEAFAEYERVAIEAGEDVPQVREGERCYLGDTVRAFHADKKNPILTHRHLGMEEPVQCVGHGDLLRHPRFGWWMVCLGVRETPGPNPGELLSYLGRESFVTPVRWEHNPTDWKLHGDGMPTLPKDDPGWPVTCAGLGRLPDEVSMTMDGEGCPEIAVRAGISVSEPALVVLDVRRCDESAVFVRGDARVRYWRIPQLPCLLPLPDSGSLIIRQDSADYAVFALRNGAVEFRLCSGGDGEERFRIEIPDDGSSRIAVLFVGNRLAIVACADERADDSSAFQDTCRNTYQDACAGVWKVLHDVDARFLSTEWAGGFVGCMAGLLPD